MKITTLLTIGSLLTLGVKAQNILHVDPQATGTKDGRNWQNAFTSLSEALNYAETTTNIDTILIAEGIYTPEHQIASGLTSDRSKAFIIKRNNIALIGGYSTNGTTHDPKVHKTILTGNIGSLQSQTDNSHKILYIVSPNSNNRLTSVYVANVEFKDAYSDENNHITIGNNSINNINGGAVHVLDANATFENCTFEANYTEEYGGGLYAINSVLTLRKNTFKSNTSNRGGGVFINTATSTIDNNTFHQNFSNELGDAMIVEMSDNTVITNNIIKHHNGSPVNLVIQFSNNIKIGNNILANNTINNAPNNQFNSLNSLIFFDTGNGEIHNNLFVNNVSKSIFGNYFAPNIWKNNIVYNNTYEAFGSLYYSELTTGGNSFTSNYVQNDNSIPNNINGSLEPLFVKADSVFENGDYRLQFCSPFVNVGQTNFLTKDILGNNRNISGGVDLGPYEKASHTNILNNATLAQKADNNLALLATCEQNDWTYYAPMSNPDSIVMAIKWNSNNDAIKTNAKVSIQVDDTYTIKTNGKDKGIAVLPRYWHVDLGNSNLSVPVSVKFFYSNKDVETMQNAIHEIGLAAIKSPIWFTLDQKFNPNNHVTIDNINNGNYNIIEPVIESINGIFSVQLNNLSTIKSGGAYVEISSMPTSVTNIDILQDINISPNPANQHLNLWIKNHKLLDKQASLLDVNGRTIMTFKLKEQTQINLSELMSGIYMIQVEDALLKFVKE